jgi:hypothetical protein
MDFTGMGYPQTISSRRLGTISILMSSFEKNMANMALESPPGRIGRWAATISTRLSEALLRTVPDLVSNTFGTWFK